MRISSCLFVIVVLVLSSQLGMESVRAQTTTVTVAANRWGWVDVSVVYAGGHNLNVGIIDRSTGEYARGSILAFDNFWVGLYPSNCNLGPLAVCGIVTQTDSGRMGIQFALNLSSFTGKGIWKLEAVANLTDTNSNPIKSSTNKSPFTIDLGLSPQIADLNVTVPSFVNATFDGTKKSPGSFLISVKLGAHTLSVPQMVTINDTTRISFDHWYILWNYLPNFYSISRTSNASLSIISNATIIAEYAAQYKVTLVVPDNRTESWNYQGVVIWTHVTPPLPIPLVSNLGAKWIFDGWYVNNQYFTNSTYASYLVETPMLIEARWHVDYTIPLLILASLVVATVLVFVIVKRTKLNQRIRLPVSREK